MVEERIEAWGERWDWVLTVGERVEDDGERSCYSDLKEGDCSSC